MLQPEQVGVRLTWGLARVRSLKEVAKRAETGDSESTSSKNGELSFSGVLGSRGHGAEVARLGLERKAYSEVGIPQGASKRRPNSAGSGSCWRRQKRSACVFS